MKSILIAAVLMLLTIITAEADTMTPAKLTALAAHIRANTSPTVTAALSIRNDVAVTDYYNSTSTTDAWAENVEARTIFEATDVTKYDGLTAGKRASQDRLERYAPIDFRRSANRKALVDIWGNTDSIPVLQGMTRKASYGELAIGTPTDTATNTVTAKKLDWVGMISIDDISNALNRY